MITLNLVSTGQKREIKLRRIYGFVKVVNLALIIITIAIAMILLAAKITLQLKFNNIVNQTTLVTKNNRGYNNHVREINNKLSFIEKVQADFIPWSHLIKSLAEMTPSDINLYYLKLNSLDQTFKIKGRAGLRNSLLDFKDKIAATAYFKDIEFPIKNLLEKENIDFEINAKLNLSSLADL